MADCHKILSLDLLRQELLAFLGLAEKDLPTRWAKDDLRAQSSEKQADILHQEFGLFERGEMTPAGHFRPVLDIESALDPALGR